MDMSLSKPLELVMDTEAWRPAGHGVPKSHIHAKSGEWIHIHRDKSGGEGSLGVIILFVILALICVGC